MDASSQEERESSSRVRVERIKAIVKESKQHQRSSGISKRVLKSIRTNQDTNKELLETFVQEEPLQPSIRRSKYSTDNEQLSPSSCMEVPWVRTSKQNSLKGQDVFDTGESSALKGRMSKLSSSLARLACVTGLEHESREDELWLDDQVKRVLREDRDGFSESNKNMKVAFLSDLYVDDSSSDGCNNVTDEFSKSSDNKVPNKQTREESSLQQYEKFMTREIDSTFAGLSRRMKTNTVALLDSINEDSALWLGLRRDSFDLGRTKSISQRDELAIVENTSL